MSESINKKRIGWIDIAKLIGMFAIYIGHFYPKDGLTHQFVFSFHVPLFFFLAGCTNTFDNEDSTCKFIIKKAKALLLPFLFFALMSVALYGLNSGSGMHESMHQIVVICEGCIRMKFIAPALWFLPCLFLMEVIFKLIKKIRRPSLIVVTACVLHFLTTSIVCSSRKEVLADPLYLHLFNWDWACFHLIYFAIGYYTFPILRDLLELDSKPKKRLFLALLLLTTVFAAHVFAQKYYVLNLLTSMPGYNNLLRDAWIVARALILILFVILASRMLSGITVLERAGTQSLYLCGNEWILKTLISETVALFGLQIVINSPLTVYIYVAVLIIICVRYLIPFEKSVVDAVKCNLGKIE